MLYSSRFNGKTFSNPVPTEVMKGGSYFKMFRDFFNKPKDHQPQEPPGPFKTQPGIFDQLEPDSLRITWIGHSTLIIEIDGKRLLTDPVWSERVSPFSHFGPRRFFAPPIALADLPPIDCILLSHDHYDHLDKKAIVYLTSKNIPLITMLKVGDRLMKWGVPSNLITQLDWWEEKKLDGFTITALPSRHFSGRWINDRFTTLWGSFAIHGPKHHVYFGADSGYYEGFKIIGERMGPFDLTMLDTGAYNPMWESIHMGPENAVQANIDLKGKLLMPMHWGTFSLAMHPWTEPVERVIKAASERSVPLLLPAPGETVIAQAYNSGWWKDHR